MTRDFSITTRLGSLLLLLFAASCAAEDTMHDAHGDLFDSRGCIPIADTPSGSIGCFVVAKKELGALPPAPLYWHIDKFANARTAGGAAAPSSQIVEAFGQTWLMTIAAQNWRPAVKGERVAEIGPLPVGSAQTYAATYMEATFMPDTRTRVHIHPGPEAWYMLEGSQCLETPEGRTIVGPGKTMMVRGDIPMVLHAYGSERRRSLVLILHDAARPASTPNNWTPKWLCRD